MAPASGIRRSCRSGQSAGGHHDERSSGDQQGESAGEQGGEDAHRGSDGDDGGGDVQGGVGVTRVHDGLQPVTGNGDSEVDRSPPPRA